MSPALNHRQTLLAAYLTDEARRLLALPGASPDMALVIPEWMYRAAGFGPLGSQRIVVDGIAMPVEWHPGVYLPCLADAEEEVLL